MAITPPSPARVALAGIILKGAFLVGVLTFGLLFPALVMWGGSTNLINWGPGLLLAGAACLLLLGNDRLASRGGAIHTSLFLLLLGLLLVRAHDSPDVSATANNSALLALAAAGFLIGKLVGVTKSRALFIGLALVSMLNLSCSVIQMSDPEWNLIYPQRSGGFPSGLFAHYSYSAAFCLGTIGLLLSRCHKEAAWLKIVFIGGAVCALVTIPLSLSRGANLALAFMVAAACALVLARAFSKSKSVISTWLPAVSLLGLVLIFASSLVPLIGRGKGPAEFYTDDVRMGFWNAATRISANHPWLGGGPGSFGRDVFHVMDGLTVEPGMVHNEALQLAVDFGYPALVAMVALIFIPVILCFWRFVNRADATHTSWAAIGLLAMLFQSNFESILHAAPSAFVAALILGQISRGLWGAETPQALETADADLNFLSAVNAHVAEYAADDPEAVPKLVSLLSQSKSEPWRRGSYRLRYWAKVHDSAALSKAVKGLGVQFKSQEAREYWATTYRLRMVRAIPSWRTDPGAALQLAEITGWAGDVGSALNFYNHAISTQGGNESLFMAHSFKGQYLYELSISAGAAGQMTRQKFYAQQAVESFQNANAALENHRAKLAPYFGKMLRDCETFEKQDM